MAAMRIIVIQNGKTDKSILVFELWFFKHFVEKPGYTRRGIAEWRHSLMLRAQVSRDHDVGAKASLHISDESFLSKTPRFTVFSASFGIM